MASAPGRLRFAPADERRRCISKPDICEGCGQKILRGKHGVAFNIRPADGLLHRMSCTNPPPIKTETVESVRRTHRL